VVGHYCSEPLALLVAITYSRQQQTFGRRQICNTVHLDQHQSQRTSFCVVKPTSRIVIMVDTVVYTVVDTVVGTVVDTVVGTVVDTAAATVGH
jgi:hypothetical protein